MFIRETDLIQSGLGLELNDEIKTFLDVKDTEKSILPYGIFKTYSNGTREFNQNYEPLNVYIRIEDKQDFIVVEGYSLILLFTEVGGLASFIFGLTQFVTHSVAKN